MSILRRLWNLMREPEPRRNEYLPPTMPEQDPLLDEFIVLERKVLQRECSHERTITVEVFGGPPGACACLICGKHLPPKWSEQVA